MSDSNEIPFTPTHEPDLTPDQIDQLAEIIERPSTEFTPVGNDGLTDEERQALADEYAAEMAKKPKSIKRRAPKPSAAVSGGKTDPVVYSKLTPGTRKSLTVYHVQRKLSEAGYKTEADVQRQRENGDFENHLAGRYGPMTTAAIEQWQAARKEPVNGILTPAQFEDLFEGDSSVEVQVDVPY